MTPRRTHKKSRNGCDTCRQRHVKCDERGPPCTGCVTRGIVCEFSKRSTSLRTSTNPSLDSLAQDGNPKTSSSTPNSEEDSKDGLMSPSSRRLLELELLHQYSTKTYQGLDFLSPEPGLWQVLVVEEALKFEFLMKQIFALAALHKAIESRQPAIKYANYALESQNEALALFRSELQTISQENSSALFMFSIMTSIFAIVPIDSISGVKSNSPLENIHVLFEFLKGSASVLNLSKSWLETGPFRWIFTTSRSTNSDAVADETFDKALARLEELNKDYTTANDSDPTIFSNAINSLSFCASGKNGRILAWLAMAGQDFMLKVKEVDPMALLVLLHWAVLLKRLSDLWWARNAGTRLIEDLAEVLVKVISSSDSGYGSGWGEAVGWAKSQC